MFTKKAFSVVLASLIVLLFTISMVYAGDTVSISKKLLKEIKEKLDILKEIEKATPEFSLDKLSIVQDIDGKIYIKDTVEIKLTLASMEYTGEGKVNADIKVFPKKEKMLAITRFGLATVAEQDETHNYTKLTNGSVYLTYKLIPAKVSLELLANRFRYGVGLSHKLSPNTKIIGGLNCEYKENFLDNKKLFIGVGFQF
jgi:hypothetical protein